MLEKKNVSANLRLTSRCTWKGRDLTHLPTGLPSRLRLVLVPQKQPQFCPRASQRTQPGPPRPPTPPLPLALTCALVALQRSR